MKPKEASTRLTMAEQVMLLCLLAKLEDKTPLDFLENCVDDLAEKMGNRYIVSRATALKDEIKRIRSDEK
jgi:hypothetical protein